MRAIYIIIAVSILLSVPTLAAPVEVAQKTDVAQKIQFVLLLLQEDVHFRDRVNGVLNQLEKTGKISHEANKEIYSAVSTQNYLRALTEHYAAKLSSTEVDELLGYFKVSGNLTLFRELLDAYAQYEGQALEYRRKELAANDPIAWAAAVNFFQSNTAAKFVALSNETEPIKLKCSIDAIVEAQKVVRTRHGLNP